MKKFAVIFLILIFALTAFADQAAYISETDAKRAVTLLQDKGAILHFCKPCGDTDSQMEFIGAIEAAATGYENYWEVKINGKGIDLAYTYFYDYQKGKWKNAAMHLEIEVSDVPEYILK